MNLPLPIRVLLWPFSWIYSAIVQWRVLLYDKGVFKQKRLRSAVVSVGNLTVGGTGKTPMVLWLAEKFLAKGKRVGILSRGYRGVDNTSDEIELLKRRLGDRVKFGVGADRYEQGSKIENETPIDVFLLDDGFQHLQLGRDVDIVMLDGSRKLEEEWLLPAGLLREPISACNRADLLVVSRKHERPNIEASDSHEHLIFYAQTRLLGFRPLQQRVVPSYLSELEPGRYFAFCAIGNPGAFFDDLRRWRVETAGTRSFRDHHKYSRVDMLELIASAKKAGATAFVTTEKDEQNLREVIFGELPVYVAAIDFALSSESEFDFALERLLKERRGTVS